MNSPDGAIAAAFDFEAAVLAPFRMQPGLRRLATGAPQLHAVDAGSRHLHEKLSALQRQPPTALQALPGFDATPALHTLAAQAAAEHPQSLVWDGRCLRALQLGWAIDDGRPVPLTASATPMAEVGACLHRLPPTWRLAALLSLACAEDFAIVDARSGVVPWLAVSLPSHWAPEAKIGLHFSQVHAPVADNQRLMVAADALVQLIAAPARWERFVWTLTPQPTLDAHPARPDAARWPAGDDDTVAARASWRSERQTFIPLPGLRQAVFTILVNVQPLAEAITTPDRARRLHAALASMSPAVLSYRGLQPVQAPLLRWLSQRADAA